MQRSTLLYTPTPLITQLYSPTVFLQLEAEPGPTPITEVTTWAITSEARDNALADVALLARAEWEEKPIRIFRHLSRSFQALVQSHTSPYWRGAPEQLPEAPHVDDSCCLGYRFPAQDGVTHAE